MHASAAVVTGGWAGPERCPRRQANSQPSVAAAESTRRRPAAASHAPHAATARNTAVGCATPDRHLAESLGLSAKPPPPPPSKPRHPLSPLPVALIPTPMPPWNQQPLTRAHFPHP
ncbi:hypothetical protein GCM10023205_46380 [Yinghuangia aomiensis]|uniref:Uncharacterized protein n=1 Tax=Yinghuangia aomiensis TaxID=676205 RepID=A0ABP9HMY5_9ACTN